MYRAWAQQQLAKGQRPERSIDGMSYDYDMRGFWKDNQQFADNGHGSDRYKKPNHPTFSDQSRFQGTPGPLGPWMGGHWGRDAMQTPGAGPHGTPSTQSWDTYTPSEQMQLTHSLEDLMRYFAPGNPNEPNSRLIIPPSWKR